MFMKNILKKYLNIFGGYMDLLYFCIAFENERNETRVL